jgi:hypothetical protein
MGGFSAVLGNPPFIVYKRLKSSIGEVSRSYIINNIAGGRKGLVDLSVYFLMNFESICSPSGNFSIITTNSVKQGDNRKIGLLGLIEQGAHIHNANTDHHWGQGAQVIVDSISFSKYKKYQPILNGNNVDSINEFLTPPGQIVGTPKPIKSNVERSHVGSYLLGTGFILSQQEANDVLSKNEHYEQVIKPYLGGKELNNTIEQKATRYAIDFQDMSLIEAQKYEAPFDIILQKVKPFRFRKKADDSYSLSKDLREKWWIYANPRRKMYDQIQQYDRVLAIAQVSRTMQVSFVETNQVLDQKLIVFSYNDYATFAFLSSNFHIIWAMKYSSRMRNDLTYSPKQVFHTIPIPHFNAIMEKLGVKLELTRKNFMKTMNIGLTELYKYVGDKKITDVQIEAIRNLHTKIDREVAKCYGWDDLEITNSFRETTQGFRYIFHQELEQKVMDRMLKLNLQVTNGGA